MYIDSVLIILFILPESPIFTGAAYTFYLTILFKTDSKLLFILLILLQAVLAKAPLTLSCILGHRSVSSSRLAFFCLLKYFINFLAFCRVVQSLNLSYEHCSTVYLASYLLNSLSSWYMTAYSHLFLRLTCHFTRSHYSLTVM